MAAYEDSYKSQLQGVSQQVARERLDGQVSEQINMLSDAVTNLRRRPGAEFLYSIQVGYGYTPEQFTAWEGVVGSRACQIVVDSKAGVLRVLNESGAEEYNVQADYLKTATSAASIQHAVVGGSMLICNLEKKPTRGALNTTKYMDPKRGGFFYVRAGAFNKEFRVQVQYKGPGAVQTVTATTTTPQGTTAGDAALATPEKIAELLAASINNGTPTHGVAAARDGAYVFLSVLTASEPVTVTTEAGLSYIVCSNAGHIRQESDLPAALPSAANGYSIVCGDSQNRRYYRYEAASRTWLETAVWGSPDELVNCPHTLTYDGAWKLEAIPFEGRYAGDDDTNPDPEFLTTGITGVASYQGRLVLLAGNMVCLSASNEPRRFYRSTVTSIVDSDTIGIGSSAASGASFRHAVPYMKDLVLFSDKVQAVLPGSSVAITPRTASVLPTSEYACDTGMRPVIVGQSLMYAMPRSADHFGVMEMLPSGQVENQYTSADATAHLPEYMRGRCRFAVTSSVSSTAVFAPSADPCCLIVHEYIWSGDEKVQSAWHKWTFARPVSTAYFRGDRIVVLFLSAERLNAFTIQPKGGRGGADGTLSYLDFCYTADIVDGKHALPDWFRLFINNFVTDEESGAGRDAIRMVVAEGDMRGSEVGCTHSANVMYTDFTFQNGKAVVGIPYLSLVTPTPPMRKDSNGVKVSTNKMTVLRFSVSTNKSSPFTVTVGDTDDPYEDTYSPVLYNSPELMPGRTIAGADNTVVVPARTRAEHTVFTLSTDGVGELNLVGLEFVAQYHEKLRRAQH